MAFVEGSRYYDAPTVSATAAGGREVTALKLRRLPRPATGRPVEVRGHDRLDLLAHRHLGDGKGFWRIADANTEPDARALTAESGRVIDMPRP